jgi:hypothetical protein
MPLAQAFAEHGHGIGDDAPIGDGPCFTCRGSHAFMEIHDKTMEAIS